MQKIIINRGHSFFSTTFVVVNVTSWLSVIFLLSALNKKREKQWKGYCFRRGMLCRIQSVRAHSRTLYRSTCAKASRADIFRPDMTKRIVHFCWEKLFLFCTTFLLLFQGGYRWQKCALDMGYSSQLVPIPHVKIENRVLLTSCLWNSTVDVFLP